MNYVVGFAFNNLYTRVLLINKTKPEWQAGKLNGVGGKIESSELAEMAMVREFKEETGVVTLTSVWRRFAILTIEGKEPSYVYFFVTVLPTPLFRSAKTMTDELVVVFDMDDLPSRATIGNLNYLLPMAKAYSTGIITETARLVE